VLMNLKRAQTAIVMIPPFAARKANVRRVTLSAPKVSWNKLRPKTISRPKTIVRATIVGPK